MKCKRIEYSWVLTHLYNRKSPLHAKFRAIEHKSIGKRVLHGSTIVTYDMTPEEEKTFIELLNKIKLEYECNDNQRKGKRNFKHRKGI